MQEGSLKTFISDFYSLPEKDQVFLSSVIHQLATGEITEDEFSGRLKKNMLFDLIKAGG